jgi:DnaK suppressor protein
MTISDTAPFRQTLIEVRERVRSSIAHLHEENPGSLEEETGELVSSSADNHMGDTATETFDRQMGVTLEENAETVLAAIEAALQRIEEGTYGTCTRCGGEIGHERLEALPYAELCIECKRTAERG